MADTPRIQSNDSDHVRQNFILNQIAERLANVGTMRSDLGLQAGQPQGRLTLQTATPVMSTTQSGKTTVYYTPYAGQCVPLYDGTRLLMTDIGGELSVATSDTTKNPAAIGASKVNDWFVWNDAGTYRLSHGPDWTSDTARSAGTALVMVNGILLNSVSITNGPAASRGTYVGTTRSNGSSQIDFKVGAIGANGSEGFVGIWNVYDRVSVAMHVGDNTDTWTYSTPTIRAANASNTMRVSFVSGLAEDGFYGKYTVNVSVTGGSSAVVGVGYDSTSAFSGARGVLDNSAASNTFANSIAGEYAAADIGFHFIQALERGGNGTDTWVGDNGGSVQQNGLFFIWRY